jgi:quercetin dioxygenase-like cupin family protein
MLAAITLFAVAPAALAAPCTEKIRNEKVLVTECTLAPHEQESDIDGHPTLIVYMSDGQVLNGTVRNSATLRTVGTGEIVGFGVGSKPIHNLGSTPLHYVRIDFLTQGNSEIWGMTGLPPNYKVLHEDNYARTYDIRIPPHGSEPQHTHHPRVVVALSGATLEHILPDGTHQPSTLKTGEIAWRPAATHIGHNLGNTPLWVIAIEPK